MDIQNVVLYSALKRKEIRTHATTWMNLEHIMLNEKFQSQKDNYGVIPQELDDIKKTLKEQN